MKRNSILFNVTTYVGKTYSDTFIVIDRVPLYTFWLSSFVERANSGASASHFTQKKWKEKIFALLALLSILCRIIRKTRDKIEFLGINGMNQCVRVSKYIGGTATSRPSARRNETTTNCAASCSAPFQRRRLFQQPQHRQKDLSTSSSLSLIHI